MLDEENKATLKNLLANDKVEEVITVLKNNANKNLINILIVISSALQEYKNHELLNTQPVEKLRIEKNRIVKTLLKIIDSNDASYESIKNKVIKENSDFKFKLSVGKNKFKTILLGIVVLIIIYLIFVYLLAKNVDDPVIILG